MEICAIVLAAGSSKRLGEPKQLVRIDGEALLERTVRILRAAGIESIFVVLGAHRERIQNGVELAEVDFVENRDWESGIASSIVAGVRAAVAHMPVLQGALISVCDQPMLSELHIRTLIADFNSSEHGLIAASGYSGIVGIPAIFPVSEFSRLLDLKGDEGARKILNDTNLLIRVRAFVGGEIDVDTPADLIALRDSR